MLQSLHHLELVISKSAQNLSQQPTDDVYQESNIKRFQNIAQVDFNRLWLMLYSGGGNHGFQNLICFLLKNDVFLVIVHQVPS